MTRLLLLRHAKAAPQEGDMADRDRPLADKAKRQMHAIAAWAETHRLRPGLVLCSSAVRTRQTLALLAGSLGEPQTLFEDGLYLADARSLLGRLQRVPERCASVLVVGHNPGLHELAVLLLQKGGGAPARHLKDSMPTAALAVFEPDGPWAALGPGAAQLVAFVTPKELGP